MHIFKEITTSIQQAKRIVITAHKSPDGDSIGSSIALLEFVHALGKNALICHPDPSPAFLNWLPKTEQILNFEHQSQQIKLALAEADLVFCLDYNHPSRVGKDMQEELEKVSAKKIMIDHHLHPSEFADLLVSQPEIGSTCELIYELIDQSGNIDLLNPAIGTAIYLGIMTDTGSFRFPSVTRRTHEIIGKLLETGVKHFEVHENVYDTNTLDRLRLRGFACSEKLEILNDVPVALMSLTLAEMKQFNHTKGDTEGLVNVALSIEGMKVAAFFAESDEGYIKISFRSKGKENPVNQLSADHFQGGGHMNAAGGRFDGNLKDAITLFKAVIGNYIA
jgi:phosphoesterase RecJ-like protein